MNGQQLKEEVRETLAKAGFYLSERHDTKGISFDIVARRDDLLLILSVMVNADSSRIKNAQELNILGDVLNGAPLFIALKGGKRRLKKGVIYSRRGVPLITPGTLSDLFLEGVPPYVFSAPGGFYVTIDSELLKEVRKEKRLSLRKLADIAGVSRKAIQKYEDGMGVDIDVALRIEEFLDEDLILPLNPLEYSEESGDINGSLDEFKGFQRTIFDSLLSMGYRIVPTCHCPFEALTSDEERVLLSGVSSQKNVDLRKKAKAVSDISHITEKDSVIFLKERYTKVSLEGIPLIDREELECVDSKDEILEMLKEREK